MEEHAVFPSSVFSVLRGVQESVTVANPAPGAEWSLTLTGSYYRRLITGGALFTASAAVANRLVGWQLTDGQNILGYVLVPAAVTAGQAPILTYTGASWQSTSFLPTAMLLGVPLIWLPPGYVLRSKTAAIDVADQYSGIHLVFDSVERQTLEQMVPDLEIDIMER